MTKKIMDYLVPWDSQGNLLHFPEVIGQKNRVWWWTNDPFMATFQLQPGVISGRSAKYVLLVSLENETVYPLFVCDLLAICQEPGVAAGGIISGWWQVRKRGQNYGLVWLHP